MPKVKLAFHAPVDVGVDDTANNEFAVSSYNLSIDKNGVLFSRPFLESEFCDLGTGAGSKVDGLFFWPEKDMALASADGKIFSINSSGVKTLLGTGLVTAGIRTIFDKNASIASMVGESKVSYTDGTTVTTVADADAPTNATHICFYDNYWLANQKDTGLFNWSDVNNIDAWQAGSSDGPNDIIRALDTTFDEIFIPCNGTNEVWYNDLTSPFAKIRGSKSNRGILAPYSLVKANNTYYWLDHERKIVMVNQRTPQVVSRPIEKALSELTNPQDCIADAMSIGTGNYLVFTFPTDNKTFVYDFAIDKWMGQWSYWSAYYSRHERWIGNCYAYANLWNKHLVGSRLDGKIYELSAGASTDIGYTVLQEKTTGHINHGTNAWKTNTSLSLRVKRVPSVPDVSFTLTIKWRDQDKTDWSLGRTIELSKGNTESFIVMLKNLGRYRTRQYKLSLSDPTPLVLLDAEESVEVVE